MVTQKSTKKPQNAVELFCGIGGFRLALNAKGLATIWANDNCPKAGKVYSDRFGINQLNQGDIRALWQEIPPHDLLTAGFPCQPFSSAGKKQGLRDTRGHLFEVIIDVLRQHRPQFFILENVKRILSMESGSHFATILSQLTRLNYRVEWRLLNATYFGLPQNRERVFLVGELTNGKDINSEFSNTTSRHYERYKIGNKYRRLTDVEYARLQGFPDNHCSAVARRDRYVLYGNAVPPPMVRWTLEKIMVTYNRKAIVSKHPVLSYKKNPPSTLL